MRRSKLSKKDEDVSPCNIRANINVLQEASSSRKGCLMWRMHCEWWIFKWELQKPAWGIIWSERITHPMMNSEWKVSVSISSGLPASSHMKHACRQRLGGHVPWAAENQCDIGMDISLSFTDTLLCKTELFLVVTGTCT